MKKTIILVFCMLLTSSIFGQWFVESNMGVVFPVRTNNFLYYNSMSLFDEIHNEYYENRKESINFNVVQSSIINLEGGYVFRGKLHSGINLSFSDNSFLKTINKNNKTVNTTILRNSNGVDNLETIQTYTKLYYSRIFTGEVFWGYGFCINNEITLIPKIGANFKVVNIFRKDNLTTERYYYDSGEKIQEASIIEKYRFPFSYSFQNLINFTTGIKVLYNINDNLSLSLNGAIDLFSKQYMPDTQIKYFEEKIIDGETLEIDENEYVNELTGNHGFYFTNVWQINFGVRYTFGSSKNKGNDK